MNFKDIKFDVTQQIEKMIKSNRLFIVDAEKEFVWQLYLESYPEAEQQGYTCNCCRSFVNRIGRTVEIKPDFSIVTIWDGEEFGNHFKKLADYIRSCEILSRWYHDERHVGYEKNWSEKHQRYFTHLRVDNIEGHLSPNASALRSDSVQRMKTYKRGVEELSLENVELVLDLINANTLHRGDQYKAAVERFIRDKKDYVEIPNEHKDLWCWLNYNLAGKAFRNTMIGQLCVELDEGKELERAVQSYENMASGTNYRRSTKLVTPTMIAQAEKDLTEANLIGCLARRHVTMNEMDPSNFIFVHGQTGRANVSVFDQMRDVTKDTPSLKGAQEITMDRFISDILPNTSEVEFFLERKHEGNMMSLIGPSNPDASGLIAWENNFTWSYNGDVATSIAQKVKSAGGKTEGKMRCSLEWFNTDDLDLHMHYVGQRNSYAINYRNKKAGGYGALDVDMNVSNLTRTPVENIIFPKYVPAGTYTFRVNQFTKRESKDVGFNIEFVFDGEYYNYGYEKAVRSKETITVCKIEVKRDGSIVFLSQLDSKPVSNELWSLTAPKFHKVKAISTSPNVWDGGKGHKHYFFFIEGLVNPESVRGFYPEHIAPEYNHLRKSIELMGTKVQAPFTNEQMSGIGFSSTSQNKFVVRTKGNLSRIFKVTT